MKSTVTDVEWTITHDFAFVFGGAELVSQVLAEDVLPGCSVKYLGGDSNVAASIHDSASQFLPSMINRWTYRYAVPAYPTMVNSATPIQGNVLASSYAFAHHVQCTGKKYVYCHSPLRQAWSGASIYSNFGPVVERIGTRLLGSYLRRRDRAAAQTADLYIATSRAVQQRVRDYYGLGFVPIVPPPIDDGRLSCGYSERSGVLWVGRIIEPYKKLSLLIEAARLCPNVEFNIVGDGRDRSALERHAPANVKFWGWCSHDEIVKHFQNASVLAFPGEDDFGITPVEAMACGTPVVAYGAGGVLDTVEDGFSGLLFDTQTAKVLADYICRGLQTSWDRGAISQNAIRTYGRKQFANSMAEVLSYG